MLGNASNVTCIRLINILIHDFLFIITEIDEMRHKCLVLLEEFPHMKYRALWLKDGLPEVLNRGY